MNKHHFWVTARLSPAVCRTVINFGIGTREDAYRTYNAAFSEYKGDSRQVAAFPALQLHFINYENVIHTQAYDKLRYTMIKQRTSEPCSSELHFDYENIRNSAGSGVQHMKFIGYAIGIENESYAFIVDENGIAQKCCTLHRHDYDEYPIEPFIIQEERTKMHSIAYVKDGHWRVKNLSDAELKVFNYDRDIREYRILESWDE